ncbi:hypothetical protein B6U99_06135 [Candidatus Geothermarchaeota archaeon ex4572_27]|nr:MAG: hypothetical protein B6U99_06135 [Candidatus Geothermarchaeota archaeon ex4572_27]
MKRAAIAVAIALMLALISAAYAQPQPNSTFPVVVAVDGEEYYFADHTSDPNDGNWIVLKGGAEWLLPSLEASYSGVSYASYVRDGRSITINSTFAEKAVKYPFAKHPTFKVGDTVEAAFKGSRELKGRTIEFRLIKAGPKAVRDALSAAFHGDTSKLKSLIASYVWGMPSYPPSR